MKRALVTGGTRGIGLAVCRLFAKKGYAVTALYSQDERAAEEARGALPSVRFVKADVSKEEELIPLFSERYGVLVNNAGVAGFAQVQDISWEEYRRVTDVNLGGTLLCCKHAVRGMLALGGGAIVNLSSVWGEVGGSCESLYSATKGAVISFTKALAKELAPSKITVNCVAPGYIETQMNGRFSEEEKAALFEEIPLGRGGTAEEVARAVLFLAEHGYVTGQVLGVNGGWA